MFSWLKTKTTSVSRTDVAPEEDFSDASEVYRFFTDLTGIHFEQNKSITTPKLVRFAKEYGCYSFLGLMDKLRFDSSAKEALINLLTVNETYFFREKDQLDFLVNYYSNTRSTLRILCAPGSTGEEAYSIAIMLAQQGHPLYTIQIISIDINTDATMSAREGLYSPRALHRLSESIKERYFIFEENYYRVHDSLKQAVSFKSCNIFEPEFLELGVFDIVFSRNMLIYFDQATVQKAIYRLLRLVRTDKSLLFFGHADLLITPDGLEEHFQDGIKYYTANEK